MVYINGCNDALKAFEQWVLFSCEQRERERERDKES
jgi:primase-polymerase (primpol)-like protein